MVEQYFGSFTQSQVILFDSAVFHRRQEQGSRQYTVDEKYIYRCHNGLWSVQKYSCIPHSNGKLGDVLKAIDAVMRECYDYGRPIQYKTTPDFLRTFGLSSLEELPPIEKINFGEPVEEQPAPAEAT